MSALARMSIVLDPGADTGPWRFARVEGPDPARALVGRSIHDAAALAPRIFNLCGAAHGFAARRALGLPGEADAAAMASESLRDHALAVLHGWPTACGEAPDRDALMGLARPGPDGTAALRRALVGEADELAAFTAGDLDGWLQAAPTGTARLLARVRREVDPAEGRAALPELTPVDIAAALCAEPPGRLPPRETGALGRVAHAPLLSALLAREGASLFARLMARLLDLLDLLAPARSSAVVPTRPGIGIAAAVRGLLGHGAQVEDGRVVAYRVLSPSAWNLAPGGILERAFSALAPRPDAPWIARLLLSAINPCVPVALEIREARCHA